PKRRTKAGEALRLGLGPLADYIWEQTGNEPVGVYAERFVSPPEPKVEPPPAEAPPAPVSEVQSEPVVVQPAEDVASEAAAVSEAPETQEKPVEAVSEPAKPQPVPPPPPKPTIKRRIDSVEEAIDGALHILAERVSENPGFRKRLRDKLMLEGV